MNSELLKKEATFVAVRSRGPGGQNVNKVSSSAILYWSIEGSLLFSIEQKQRIHLKLKSHINVEGEVYVRSDEFRDLEQNKRRCLEKLTDWLAKALHEHKKRKATRPTYGSKQKKRQKKSQRSEVKSQRRKVDY